MKESGDSNAVRVFGRGLRVPQRSQLRTSVLSKNERRFTRHLDEKLENVTVKMTNMSFLPPFNKPQPLLSGCNCPAFTGARLRTFTTGYVNLETKQYMAT